MMSIYFNNKILSKLFIQNNWVGFPQKVVLKMDN